MLSSQGLCTPHALAARRLVGGHAHLSTHPGLVFVPYVFARRLLGSRSRDKKWSDKARRKRKGGEGGEGKACEQWKRWKGKARKKTLAHSPAAPAAIMSRLPVVVPAAVAQLRPHSRTGSVPPELLTAENLTRTAERLQVSGFRSVSVAPVLEHGACKPDHMTAPTLSRSRTVPKQRRRKDAGPMTVAEIRDVYASTRRAMDAAVLPTSQLHPKLSIDLQWEQDAANRQALDQPVPVARREQKKEHRKKREINEEPVGAHGHQVQAEFVDGRAIRLASTGHDRLSSGRSDWLRHTFPASGEPGLSYIMELGLKHDVLSANRRSQLCLERYPPLTARARGTYVYGLHGDIVMANSLVADLQPPVPNTNAKGEDQTHARIEENERPPTSTFPYQARRGLKTAGGGTDWSSLNAQEREKRLRDDFGAMLVQFKRFVHGLVLAAGEWYFKANVSDRNEMCDTIVQLHTAFRKIMVEQRPFEIHETCRPIPSLDEVHDLLTEGHSTFITNLMLHDSKRGDDELAQFDVNAFKFARRVDWKATAALRVRLIEASMELAAIKNTARNGTKKKSWKKIKAATTTGMVRHTVPLAAKTLPKDSLLASTLRDSLRDTALDRHSHVAIDAPQVCHRTESKKVSEELDKVMIDQMDLKVQRKIEDIRRAMRSKHVDEANSSGSNCFRKLKMEMTHIKTSAELEKIGKRGWTPPAVQESDPASRPRHFATDD